MAVIKNSTITNINWEGVAKDLGKGTSKAANCQWYRFTKAFAVNGSPKTTKTNGSKKRGIEEVGDGEELEGDVVRKQPQLAKKEKVKGRGRGRKVKMETPESDEEDEFYGDESEEEVVVEAGEVGEEEDDADADDA